MGIHVRFRIKVDLVAPSAKFRRKYWRLQWRDLRTGQIYTCTTGTTQREEAVAIRVELRQMLEQKFGRCKLKPQAPPRPRVPTLGDVRALLAEQAQGWAAGLARRHTVERTLAALARRAEAKRARRAEARRARQQEPVPFGFRRGKPNEARFVPSPYPRRCAQLFLRWLSREGLTYKEITRRCWCERIYTNRYHKGERVEWSLGQVRRVMQLELELQEQEATSGAVYAQKLIDDVEIKGRLHTY